MPLARSSSVRESARRRVVVIDRDRLLAEMLGFALESQLGFKAVRVFLGGQLALAHCRTAPPELVIIDLQLPDMEGRQLVRALRRDCPKAQILVIASEPNPNLPGDLLKLGVTGYLDKSCTFAVVREAIHRILNGGIFFSAKASGEKLKGAGNAKSAGA